MKAKLLKRLRREANRKFGILIFFRKDGSGNLREIYKVGNLSTITPESDGTGIIEYTLDVAKQRLDSRRKGYILDYVRQRKTTKRRSI